MRVRVMAFEEVVMVFNATALLDSEYFIKMEADHLGRDGMVVEFTTTSSISAYHDYRVVVSLNPVLG
jgi:hypothetical protein